MMEDDDNYPEEEENDLNIDIKPNDNNYKEEKAN